MTTITSDFAANVWRILVQPGAQVREGDTVLILESMKMEIPVEAPGDGTVTVLEVAEGESVEEGDALFVVE